jgi:tetratricopeptide (TPR) repeat protein
MAKSLKPPVVPPDGGGDPYQQALALLEQARQFTDHRRRSVLARRALNLAPDCVEAHLLLAEGTRSPFQAVVFYRLGVEAAERNLSSQSLPPESGHCWENLATRPYLRARAGLARALWQCSRADEALAHWRDLLRLDTSDHLGIRYLLAARLLELGRDRDLDDLLRQYADDPGAYLTWVAALALFRRSGASVEARHALETALASNPQVPVYLLGQQPLPRKRSAFIVRGEASEAVAVATETLNAWRSTPGALAWLADQLNAWFG